MMPVTTLSFFFAIEGKNASVPAIHNESTIEGIVSEYAIISSRLIGIKPEQILYRLTINIESSENISDKPNLLGNKKGQDIQFYSREKLSPELFGKVIRAKVEFTGDEKGGLFWIKNINILNRGRKNL